MDKLICDKKMLCSNLGNQLVTLDFEQSFNDQTLADIIQWVPLYSKKLEIIELFLIYFIIF